MRRQLPFMLLLCLTVLFSGLQEASAIENSSDSNPNPADETDPIPVKTLTTGKVGISAVPLNWQDTEENWLNVFSKAKEAGAQLLSGGNMQWNEEIEPSPGVFNWSSMDRFFSVLEKHGFDFEFSCDMGGAFFHDKIQSPKDIQFESFTGPVFLNRYKGMITSFLNRFGDKVTYLVIHAEGAYTYFDRYPKQLGDYCQFIKEIGEHIKRQNPHSKVGLNTDPHNKDDFLARMGEVTDYMAYDFMKLPGHIDRPSDLERMVKRLIRLANGKKIAIQNGGWSTSSVENSSDEQQVEFIREFYRVLYEYRDKIEYASFYTVYDDDTTITGPIYRAMFPDYPESFVKKMVESNGRFGVFRHDGTPKPGWYELKKQAAKYYQRLRHQ